MAPIDHTHKREIIDTSISTICLFRLVREHTFASKNTVLVIIIVIIIIISSSSIVQKNLAYHVHVIHMKRQALFS